MRGGVWGGKAANVVQLALIYGWLSLLAPLADTDTSYSIYILVAVLAVVCRGKSETPGQLDWNGKKNRVVLVLAAFLSLAVVLANYALLEPWSALQSKVSALVLFAGGSVWQSQSFGGWQRIFRCQGQQRKETIRCGCFSLVLRS